VTTYDESLLSKKFRPNIIVYLKGEYFSVHQPDSGLVIDSDKVGMVKSLVLNPVTIDPSRPSTTISTISFSLLDKAGVVTNLFLNESNYLQNEEVLVYLGRVGVSMAFSDYFLLPRCYISQCSKNDGSWNFSTQEKKDRINRRVFSASTKLSGSILADTTEITVQDVTKIRDSGLVKIENEFLSYTGRDLVNGRITGCVRGERDTIAATHALGKDVYQADEIQANPIEILISLLVSTGGGGSYDTLIDGAAIDESLIDVTQMEDVRDQLVSGIEFNLALSNIESLQQFIENEILYPLGLRLRTNSNSKIGLAVLNRTYFDVDTKDFTHDNITKNPSFSVVDSKIVNKVKVNWAWDDATADFLKVYEQEDAGSIASFGEQILEISMKGPRESLGGLDIVTDVADQFIKRFSVPRPEISLSMQMDASTALIGDKVNFESALVVDIDTGLLGLEKDLELVSRAINVQTGDVTTKLAFTWYSGVRQCFISPTDTIVSTASQARAAIATGRGALYRKTWVLKLWDNIAREFVSGETNTISSVVGDEIFFTNDWVATLNTDRRFVFADYDEVVEQQKKYCFISNDGNNFTDGKPAYKITT